jgi:hypothetical protein
MNKIQTTIDTIKVHSQRWNRQKLRRLYQLPPLSMWQLSRILRRKSMQQKWKRYVHHNGNSFISYLISWAKHKCRSFPRVFFVDIQLQVNASNFKINTYERKPNGSFKRVTRPIGEELAAKRCKRITFSKTVDPCLKNFWSIGLQGSLFNSDAEHGWVFKDKDCRAYKISELPISDPEMRPSAIPTGSPNLSAKPSARPTKCRCTSREQSTG